MASIQQRGQRWQATVRRKGRPSRSRSFASRAEAEAWADRIEQRLVRRGVTLAEAIDRYCSDPDVRLSRHQQTVLRWWRARLGTRALAGLRRSDFLAAQDALRRLPGRFGRRLSPASTNWRLAQAQAVLTYAERRDWIGSNPARIAKIPEQTRREFLLSPEQRNRLLDACRASSEPALYGIVLAAMASGARAGELQALHWSDVDLERGMAALWQTKAKVRRAIVLRGPALDWLREHAQGATPQQHVFRHRDARVPFEYRASWERARRLAGLEGLRFHDLRHGAATELARAGASGRELQALLGHRSSQMVQRYAHTLDEHLVELGDRLASRTFRPAVEGASDA